ncbi:MAG: putative lipid II flippase FtsW [candidate division Zixibacteria bacterium]|nr:putative lipid II flippase FtsW [candidate division Zixibacteria bacterium]
MVRKTTRAQKSEGHIDERLLIAYLLMLVAGLIAVYSTSSMIAESRFGSHLFFLQHQFVWALLSLCTMWVLVRLDLVRFAAWSVPAFFIMLGLLALVFLAEPRNGSHRWLFLGPLTIQPSEFFKFVMIYFLAFSLSNRDRNMGDWRGLLLRYGPLMGVALLLILLEPDLGTTIVIFGTAVGVFFLAGAKIKHLLMAATPMVGAAAILVFVVGYKKARVMDYIASLADPLQGSYQGTQAALTLGAGGLFGSGLGEGSQKLFFLPYPHTDFIFAAVGQEVGFLRLVLLLVLMMYMLLRGFKIALGQPDRFGYLLAAGMALSLFVNIAVNLGVVTSLLPVTGLPLPFVSYGGSSLLISSVAIGVLLNLSRRVRS